MIGALRAMLESNAQTAVGGSFGERLPKRQQLRDEILKRLVNGMTTAFIDVGFDHRAWKATDIFDAKMRRNLKCPQPRRARELCLARIERIAVIDADRGDPDVQGLGFSRELLGEGLPLGMVDAARPGI